MHEIADAATLLADCRRILVYTGAGISTESGIPDFRGPSGIWKTADPADFTLQRYLTNEEFRRDSWRRKFEANALNQAKPNSAHDAIVRLWKANRVVGVVTQNIDGLHRAAGLPPDAVAELHGNANGVVCTECGDHPERAAIEARWRAGESDPPCSRCGGILKSTMVLFGELLPEAEFARASLWAAMADAALAIGTTLGVYPAAEIPLQVAARGDAFVIINRGPTEHDRIATVRLEGRAGDLVPALVTELVGA